MGAHAEATYRGATATTSGCLYPVIRDSVSRQLTEGGAPGIGMIWIQGRTKQGEAQARRPQGASAGRLGRSKLLGWAFATTAT